MRALDLGPTPGLLRHLEERGSLERVLIQHDDLVWVEFDNARGWQGSRHLSVEGFAELLAASEAGQGAPKDELGRLLHALWRNDIDARQHLGRTLARLHAIAPGERSGVPQ
ncbi:MAG TPA: hypothetical protein VJN18_15490 [Polyangiaceae bacterium]|nr:hypothetical protein [Polyangiaceae bacterium]